MKVHVVDPKAVLWEGEATSVVVPASEGDLGILPGRQPVLAILRPGTVRIHTAVSEPVVIDVHAGFVSVDQDLVEIVVDNTAGTRK